MTLRTWAPHVPLCEYQGGIVEKQQEWQQEGRPFLLAVEDPQQPGTDIGSGSFNIQEVH